MELAGMSIGIQKAGGDYRGSCDPRYIQDNFFKDEVSTMQSQHLFHCLAATLLTLGLAQSAAAKGDNDNRTRMECDGNAALEDASLSAKYEQRGNREKFSVELEAQPGGSFSAGDIVQINVDGQTVGTIELFDLGDIVGELNFDTTAQADDADLPFPANFPGISAGTMVQAGTQLGCDLQSR